MKCEQELCEYWGGDGNVCPCALLDLKDDDRSISAMSDGPYGYGYEEDR